MPHAQTVCNRDILCFNALFGRFQQKNLSHKNAVCLPFLFRGILNLTLLHVCRHNLHFIESLYKYI